MEIDKRSLLISVKAMPFIDTVRPFCIAEQISAASISVPSNIAEGSERGSNKEFKRFLELASGSASELVTQLTVLKLTNRLPEIDLEKRMKETKEINNMIRGFMNSLNE